MVTVVANLAQFGGYSQYHVYWKVYIGWLLWELEYAIKIQIAFQMIQNYKIDNRLNAGQQNMKLIYVPQIDGRGRISQFVLG